MIPNHSCPRSAADYSSWRWHSPPPRITLPHRTGPHHEQERSPHRRNNFRLSLEPLEAREVPAVVTFTVTTSSDDPDNNLADNFPYTNANQDVSLRSAMDHINANGNGNDTYVIDFTLPPPGPPMPGEPEGPLPELIIPLKSQLPTLDANRDVKIVGTNDRRVRITRSIDEGVTEKFRFLDVAADATLRVEGLKLTGADNGVNGGFGGAIRNQSGGTLAVANCEFRANLAELGGAIGNEGTLTVTGGGANVPTLFVSNRSLSQGGAINTGAVGTCSAAISDSEFVGNVAGDHPLGATQKGGAISYKSGGTLTLDRCTFLGNRAKDGGALYASIPGAPGAQPSVIASDCVFDGNSAESDGNGGAAFMSTVNGRFNRCEFKNNVAAKEGGAILQDKGELTLDSNVFGLNTANGPKKSNQVGNRLNPGPAPITFIGNNSSCYVIEL